MTGERDHIDALREDLDVELQAHERARDAVGPASGADSTGTVTARLDADGQVSTFQVDGGWRQMMTPADLPSAVLGAYHAAAEVRTEQFLSTATDGEAPTRPRPGGRDQTDLSLELVAKLRDADLPQATLQGLGEMLDELIASTDEAFRMVDDQLSSPATGRSTSRHATATLSGGGELLSVEYDEKWLESAHSFNIGRETTEAVHDAVAQQARRSVSAIADDSGLTRLQQLTNDPAAVMRLLGLGDQA